MSMKEAMLKAWKSQKQPVKKELTIEQVLSVGGETKYEGIFVTCQTQAMTFNSKYCRKSKYYIIDASGSYIFLHTRSRATAQKIIGDLYGRDSVGRSKYTLRVDGKL